MKINIKDIPVSIWFLAAVSLALAFISKDQYLLTLFAFAGIYVIAVSGLDLLFGYSGQISCLLCHWGIYIGAPVH